MFAHAYFAAGFYAPTYFPPLEEVAAALAEVPAWWRQRYRWSLDRRRGRIRWYDDKGNEVTLDLKEEGRKIFVVPTGVKPYKPVRGLRIVHGGNR